MIVEHKTLFIVRHAKAEGQEPTAKLSAEGVFQADQLKEQLKKLQIEKIICSPLSRAIQTIKPFVDEKGIHMEIDDRLAERILSVHDMDDWQDRLAQTFNEHDVRFEGGETSREALARIGGVVQDVLKRNETTLLVSHGNLISLFLQSLDNQFGFHEWQAMKNPHIFRIEYEGGRGMFYDLG
jgi:2,3-bisphosphoglycerate-dependent phosphoglycerate mutase